MLRRFSLLFIALLFASTLPAAAPREHECRWADGAVAIDGVADEGAWNSAPWIDQFGLPWLSEKARPPLTATKAKVLWDREYFYFFAEMSDADLFADIREHDGQIWNNDVFELFFRPADDKPGYYEFQVNAAGAKLDMFLPRRGAGGYDRFKADGAFDFEAKVKLRGTLNQWSDRDEGWTVEGRIAWRSFARTGGRPAVDERWKFTLCRYDYSVDFEGPELSNINPASTRAHPDFHHFEDYPALRFVGPPAASAAQPYGVDVLPPCVTSRVVGSPEPPLPYRAERAYPNLKLNYPICVAHQPGTDYLWAIVQPFSYGQTNVVRFRDRPEVSETEPVLPAAKEVVQYDLCFHPKFAENGYVYIGSNGKFEGSTGKVSRVTRYTVARTAPFALDPASALVIIEWPSDGHNGAAICFGRDGMLYVTSGDGTSDSDTNLAGQDLTKLLAKVLRIDVDRPAPGKPYSVPADNPFVGRPGVVPETYACGLRNPWRIHCDRQTGHLWCTQNGQDLWEQVYFVRPGDNYGWSVTEGSHDFYPNRPAGPRPFALPAAEHHHSEARSLTGGIVYYGEALPELRGAYLYGDYSTGKIWGVQHDGTKILPTRELADTTLAITCFAADSRGELLIADHRAKDKDGGLYRLIPSPPDAARADFPRRLSETGLFASVARHEPAAGLLPYSVNAPLWSDGTYKVRYLAIPHKPGEDRRIDFGHFRGWGFPDETVLVKSFALEMEPGRPASRKWIETRLLTKQQGEWVGYSYRWNDDQSDAELVPKEGADREFLLAAAGPAAAPRKQLWRYPSRTECMVCHSRAANFVLGLSTVQMNREHDYGHGRVDNQLRVLEHLGLLRVNYWSEEQEYWRQTARAEGKSQAEIDKLVAARTATRDQRSPLGHNSLLHVPPEKLPRLVDPYDRNADLDRRARSYLHANCAICHVEAGGGNARLEIEFHTPREKTNLFDAVPVHHKFELPEARIIAPGHPERSVLLHRVAMRGAGQMPQLATTLVDEAAVQMLREWIERMPAANE